MAPLLAVARRVVTNVPCKRILGNRSFQTASPRMAGGHEVHSHANDPNAYIHAERMYDLQAMTNRKLKFGLGVTAVVVLGTGIPLVAVFHAQSKTAS